MENIKKDRKTMEEGIEKLISQFISKNPAFTVEEISVSTEYVTDVRSSFKILTRLDVSSKVALL